MDGFEGKTERARVNVTAGPEGITLSIEDSGIGFDPSSVEGRPGLGFVSMRERLRTVRGTVHVDSSPSRGTRVRVSVPPASLAPLATAGSPERQASTPGPT